MRVHDGYCATTEIDAINSGSLIWTPGPEFGQVYNFQVETYRDQQYLTFWSGDNSVGGHGAGAYFMVRL